MSPGYPSGTGHPPHQRSAIDLCVSVRSFTLFHETRNGDVWFLRGGASTTLQGLLDDD